jgi:2-succinyl-5-enolpyruvyl-6-hydroxy-3-cyclohexene-1-carboxylate synthase
VPPSGKIGRVNPSTALATVLVDELIRCGVREAVLCPGSRSAPLAYALQDADRAGRLRLHMRVDERSAGFLALGLAKVTRVPAVVVTTSGTAVANLHPAVLEAHHAHVPLVVLSADRPPELRGTGANQTTAQPGIFGAVVRWTQDLGAPERRPGQQAAWRSTVCRAVAAATGRPSGVPGPAHLNVPLREPLVPMDQGEWPEPLAGRAGGEPWVRVAGSATTGDTAGSRAVTPLERTLVVVGDLPEPGQAEAAIRWAIDSGWPVVAEPFSSAHGALPHGPLLLAAEDWLERHLPDRVITVGRVTLARPVARLLSNPSVRVEAVTADPAWADPSHVVSAVHGLGVLRVPVPTAGAGDWAAEWEQAGRAVAKAVADAAHPWPSGLAVAEAVGTSVAPGALLFLGSSNAVRDLDLATHPAGDRPAVVASRGLAGIDGCVSTAVGLALAGGGPSYALLGDLTFLHDANGLLIGPAEPRPDLTIVVANDDGGGIFTLLEPGEPARAADFERVFGTPTGTDLAALCAAHGVPHRVAATRDDLAAAVAERPRGLRVVEVRLDRSGHREAHARLRATAAEALGPSR